jgi:hypothetical protein
MTLYKKSQQDTSVIPVRLTRFSHLGFYHLLTSASPLMPLLAFQENRKELKQIRTCLTLEIIRESADVDVFY